MRNSFGDLIISLFKNREFEEPDAPVEDAQELLDVLPNCLQHLAPCVPKATAVAIQSAKCSQLHTRGGDKLPDNLVIAFTPPVNPLTVQWGAANKNSELALKIGTTVQHPIIRS